MRPLKNLLGGAYLLLLYGVSLPYWGLQAIRARLKDPPRPAIQSSCLSVLPYLILFILAAAPALYLGWGHIGAFNSPDESAASLAARTFAEDGRLYLEDELTLSTSSRLGGPRGFVQHDGRAVPIYPLGHPLALGLAQKAFGGSTALILAVIPGLLILGLALFLRLLVPGSPPYLGFVFLGVTPLWYWSSRVYMDLALTFLFVAGGLICFVLALRRGSLWWLFWGSSAFAVASLSRLSEAPLLLLVAVAFIIAIVRRSTPFSFPSLLRVFSVYGLGQVALFVIPMALLNWWTYGSPTDIGYVLFYEQYYPELIPDESNLLIEAVGFVWSGFFPTPMSLTVFKNGLFYQLVLLAPILLALGVAGFWVSRRLLMRVFGYGGVALLVVTLAYVLVSRTNPGTYGALTEDPFILASLVRYWMPVYLALGIGAAYALSHAAKAVSIALIIGLVGISSFQVWLAGPESMVKLRTIMDDRATQYRTALEEHTEDNAVIFAVGRIDKWVSPFRRTVGVWSSEPDSRALEDLAESAIGAHRLGRPAYFAFDPNISGYDNAWKTLNRNLQDGVLEIEMLVPAKMGFGLWKVNELRPPLVMEQVDQDTYRAQTSAPRADFALSIEMDGSPVNRVSNPSFESDLSGWSGPDFGEFMQRSDEAAYFGEYSLRLELPPDAPKGHLVRRTESVKLKPSTEEDWLALARVKATQLNNARAEMRVFLHDDSGNVVGRETVLVAEASDKFITVGLAGSTSHLNVAIVELQLNLRSLQKGGSGVVYWDGAELKPVPRALVQSCDKATSWCAWKDESHQTKVWDGGIELIKVKTEDGSEVDLNGPFQVNDQLVFREDGIYLDRKLDSSETRLADFARPQPDSRLDLVVTALNAPSLRVVLSN